MSSDAIVVGEEWISEHYFTTDATKESFKARVLARRSDWDATKEQGNPRTRFTAARTSLLNRLATLDATTNDHASDVRAINADVRSILGYDGIGLTRTVQGPVTFVHAAGLEHTPGLAIIDALPAETIEDLLAKDASNLAEPFLPAGVDADERDAPRTTRTRSPRWLGCCRCSSSTTTTSRRSRWCSPARTSWWPSGSGGPRVATSPSTCSSWPSATTTRRVARSTGR